MKGILLDADSGDIILDSNERIAIGDIDTQNAQLIIVAHKGEIKESSLKGVGADDFAEDHSPERLIRGIKREFFDEGLHISSLQVNERGIELDVNYK